MAIRLTSIMEILLNILWLKKDFRLRDHEPMIQALKDQCLVIFIYEPSVSYNYDFDIRHWRFIYQSIEDLKKQGLTVHSFYGEAIDVFKYLTDHYHKIEIFSHQETGNDLTFKRDLKIKAFCKKNEIKWHEYQNNAVIRCLKNRNTWDALWAKYVKSRLFDKPVSMKNVEQNIDHPFKLSIDLKENLVIRDDRVLSGGESFALKQLNQFLEDKIENYMDTISYPEKSRYYSSMLSSYLTYGNISIKQIYQACENKNKNIQNKFSLNQFMARLKWHCHFIQKLEMEPEIEFSNINSAFNQIRQKKNKVYLKAWKEGQTGYPLIDAAMRCVQVTEFLNFRLRATVVSFLTHILWQPWQSGAGFLARQFLDYEPGIHFSQFQMQAGTTGINTIRIYNPIKQSKEKDKEGTFIKKWVPELRKLPLEYIHEPWKVSEMDSLLYDFMLGKDYPRPIVDFSECYKNAQEKLWSLKNSSKSIQNNKKILAKHTRRKRK